MLTVHLPHKLALTNFDAEKEAYDMHLGMAELGKEYIISAIETDDEELNRFLFSLGCYAGEPITVISHRRSSYTVAIKDGRYNIDNRLAAAILID